MTGYWVLFYMRSKNVLSFDYFSKLLSDNKWAISDYFLHIETGYKLLVIGCNTQEELLQVSKLWFEKNLVKIWFE